jgi:hypothetical protein
MGAAVALLSKFGRAVTAIFDESDNLDLSSMGTGTYITIGGVRIYNFTSAITPNSTTTSAPSGSYGFTSNATGLGSIFQSDGSKWQLLVHYRAHAIQSTATTIATTSNTDSYIIAPVTGILTSADFSGIDALTQHASNIITFSITNLGQDGLGTTVMLAATDANTTKTTTGTAIAANAKRALTLTGTAADLAVVQGDRLRIRYAAGGTLANTVTGAITEARFQRTA